MKKLALLFLSAALAVSVSAQDAPDPASISPAPKFKANYLNLSFSNQKMTFTDGIFDYATESSRFGLGFTIGHSFILHPKPIAKMIRIGLDATWFDINYGNWSETDMDEKLWMHKFDIAMGVGPGIHITPIGKLGIHAYFRFNPTLSMLFHNYNDDLEIDGGYASYFTTGGAVSWGVISLGIEARFGSGKYHTFKAAGDDNGDGLGDFSLDKQKIKAKGFRAYIGFRF